MATKVIVCPECSQLVAYGRLSCPSCGTLLASVEGSERGQRPTVVPGITEPPKLRPDDEVAPARVATGRPDGADEGPSGTKQAEAVPGHNWPPAPANPSALNPSAILGDGSSRKAPRPGQASLLADLPFDAPASLGGWLIALGALAGLAGLLLPWGDAMFLAGAGTGYFGTWGLAGPGHGFAFVAVLLTLALAILPTRVPGWVRDRAMAPVAGGILVGLAWPYLLGVVQPQVGVLVTAAGGVLLVTGAVQLARPARVVAEGRNEGSPPPV